MKGKKGKKRVLVDDDSDLCGQCKKVIEKDYHHSCELKHEGCVGEHLCEDCKEMNLQTWVGMYEADGTACKGCQIQQAHMDCDDAYMDKKITYERWKKFKLSIRE